MKLHSPFAIAPNLQAGLQIGNDWVTLGYSYVQDPEGRTVYKATFLIGGKEYTDESLKSGCQGGDLQEGFVSLLSFLYFAATTKEENDLFQKEVLDWAKENIGELEMLAFEIEEGHEDEVLIEED